MHCSIPQDRDVLGRIFSSTYCKLVIFISNMLSEALQISFSVSVEPKDLLAKLTNLCLHTAIKQSWGRTFKNNPPLPRPTAQLFSLDFIYKQLLP